MENPNREKIWLTITETLEEVLSQQGRKISPMSPESFINRDLDVSSIDFVHTLMGLEEKLDQAFEFEKIALRDGKYRDDLTLGELWEFMVESDAATGMSNSAAAS
jgi:acyl carrier protein